MSKRAVYCRIHRLKKKITDGVSAACHRGLPACDVLSFFTGRCFRGAWQIRRQRKTHYPFFIVSLFGGICGIILNDMIYCLCRLERDREENEMIK